MASTTTGVLTFLNNTVSDNAATVAGGGVAIDIHSHQGAADLTNNIIWNNAPLAPATCGDIDIDTNPDDTGPHAAVDIFNNNFDTTNGLCVTDPAFPALDVSNILYEEYGERFKPAPVLKRKVAANHIGRKVKKGWFDYSK